MFVIQISVILSNPGGCDSAVLHALTEALNIGAIHSVEHPLLTGERVAEALHVQAELPLCDCGPPSLSTSVPFIMSALGSQLLCTERGC
jgi:hypothetical protein